MVMSVAAIPRDSVARAFKQVMVKRDITTARADSMPKGGLPHGSERTADGRRVLDQLVQELHHCKLNHEALREKINSRKVILDERNQLLDVLQRNLDDIKTENEKLASALGNDRGPCR
jgi:hypothetical protein